MRKIDTDDLIRRHAERLRGIYEDRTAGDHTFTGVLSEFLREIRGANGTRSTRVGIVLTDCATGQTTERGAGLIMAPLDEVVSDPGLAIEMIGEDIASWWRFHENAPRGR